MLLLDTNVVSEFMRPRPSPHVLDWVAAQPLAETAIAAITVMEVRFGIALLPWSKRRADLDAKFNSSSKGSRAASCPSTKRPPVLARTSAPSAARWAIR